MKVKNVMVQKLRDIGTCASALRIALIAMLLGLLFAGLYPFNFLPRNQVAWLPDTDGLRFHGYGEVYGPSPLDPGEPHGPIDSAGGISIELAVTPKGGTPPQVEEMLSIYRSQGEESFALERSVTDLVLAGNFRNLQGQNKFRRLYLDDVLHAGTLRLVTVTSGPGGTVVYLDGVAQKTYSDLFLTDDNFRGTLLLGQTVRAHQDWNGDIQGLALHRRVLSPEEVASGAAAWKTGKEDSSQQRMKDAAVYLFNERKGRRVQSHGGLGRDLLIPLRLRALHPTALGIPSLHDLTNVSDVSLNIGGFIPLGALLVFYWRLVSRGSKSRAVWTAMLAGALISLTIELLQIYLPSRDSSLLDVINNILGTVIGAAIAAAVPVRIRGRVAGTPR